jgi:NADH:ubiquinone oxidoreductase subunit E
MGPMLQIREKYYENLDPQKMDQLLDDLSKE